MHNLRSPGSGGATNGSGAGLGEELVGLVAKSEGAKIENGNPFFAYYGSGAAAQGSDGFSDSDRMMGLGGGKGLLGGEEEHVEVALLEPVDMEFEMVFGRVVLKTFEKGEVLMIDCLQ